MTTYKLQSPYDRVTVSMIPTPKGDGSFSLIFYMDNAPCDRQQLENYIKMPTATLLKKIAHQEIRWAPCEEVKD